MKPRFKKFLSMLMVFSMLMQYTFTVQVFAEGPEDAGTSVEAVQEDKAAEEAAKKAAEEKAAAEAAAKKAAEEKAAAEAAAKKAAEEKAAAEAAAQKAAEEKAAAEQASEPAVAPAQPAVPEQTEEPEQGQIPSEDKSMNASEQIDLEQARAPDEEASGEPTEEQLTEQPLEMTEELTEEEPEEEEEKFPEFKHSESVGGMTVRINAPEGALPEGVKVVITPVAASAVEGAVKATMGENAEVVKAVDITFYDKDGKEVTPKKAISVKFVSSEIKKAENPSVLHIADSGAAEMADNGSVSGSTASFVSDNFSIYVVVEEGEDARLTVNFVKADGTTASMQINERQAATHIEQYIYDPGVGEIPSGAMFMGWTDKQNYGKEDAANGKTIATVRDEVVQALGKEGFKDGDEVTYYAMVFESYIITYLDEEGVTLKTEHLLYPMNDTSAHSYTANLAYIPYVKPEYAALGTTAEFLGWEDQDSKELYENGQSFSVSKDVTLKAKVGVGYWLTFADNMKSATYTQPQFVQRGDKPVVPEAPTRAGYNFDGWYTEDADPAARDGQVAGEEFDFNKELEKTTTVYGKWSKKASASYSVVIWKQNVEDLTKYDYERTITVNNATVGNNTYQITARGAGNNRTARVYTSNNNYTDVSFEGFHLSTTKPNANGFDPQTAVAAEGNTVINVYFDRNEHTLTFRQDRYGTVYKTITARYGENIGSNFPITDNGAQAGWRWDPQNSNTYNQVMVYIDIMPDEDVTFYRDTGAGKDTMYMEFYVEKLPEQTTERTWNGRNFVKQGNTITAKYNFFTEDEDFIDLPGFTKFGSDPAFNRQGQADPGNGGTIRFYYTRNNYEINYTDGVYGKYTDGQFAPIEEDKLPESAFTDATNIPYQSDISGRGSYTPSRAGYVFLGWYADEGCSTKYDFDKMPANNVTVYAKWVASEFAVQLHPNDSEADPVQYATEGGQAESFRADYGDKVGDPGASRENFDLVGWYADEALTKAYDFSVFELNETLISNGYAVAYTDASRDSVIGKLDLYAKWRSKLDGSKGIQVIYDAGQGTGAPTDPNYYTDQAEAVAGSGATATDTEKVFSHWVIQKWNAEAGAYEDTEETVFPGDTFQVNKSYAKQVDIVDTGDGIDKEFYIQLRAEYIEKDKEILTYINWYNNYDGGLVDKSENIKINEAVNIPAAPTRTGYEFKGWIRGIEENGPTTTLTELWLTYTGEGYTHNGGEAATQVAADENLVGDGTQHHALYAKWEAADVNYNVEFWYQNEDGTDYIKDAELSETRTAKTGETVEATAADKAQTKGGEYELVTGDPSVLSATVAADGSTVLKLYFNHSKAEVTVEHYLLGEEEAFKTDTFADQQVGSTFTATPETKYLEKDLTVNSYDPAQAVTVTSGDNIIKIYYTLPLTITAKTDSKVYDGQPLNGEYGVSGALNTTDKAIIEAMLEEAPSITEVSESPRAYQHPEIEGLPAYYVPTYEEGTLTITPVTSKVTVTITENSGSEKYDGAAKSVTGYTVSISNPLYTEADFEFTGNAAVSGTDAGSYPMELAATDFANKSANFTNVEFVIVDGTLEISKRSVILTSATDEKVYDGTALTNDEVTVSGDGFATGEGASYSVTGSQTEKGSSANAFTYTLNDGTKADNYEISKVEGTLTVTESTDKVTVTITENSGSEKYDGTAKSVTGYTVSISNPLYTEEDFEFTGNAAVSGTDAGSYPMELKAEDFVNHSKNFTNVEFIIVDGTLEISKRSVILTSASDEKVYDGQPLTNDEVTVSGDGFATGEGASYEVTGSQTEKGSSPNAFTYTLNNGTKADNYEISTVEGTLTVTAQTDKVTVRIRENSGSKMYDGIEETVSGYTVQSISNPMYTEADFEFTGNATVSGTDAGSYPMEITAADFVNKNENFAEVEFIIEDGTLEISKRSVVLTSATDEKVYDGQPLTNDEVTVTGDGFVEGEGATFDVTGTRTEKGSSPNAFTYTLNEGTKADNYEISKVEGTLTVTAVTDEVKVQITENSGSAKYDGAEKKAEGYTVSINNSLYTEADFEFTGEAIVTGIDAGSYPMELAVADFNNLNPNFDNVTFEIIDGSLEISKREIKLTSATDSKVYDGTALTNDEVTVGGDGFAAGEGATYEVTGTQTLVGSSENTFTYTLNEGTKADNYTITTENGTLTVTDGTDPGDEEEVDPALVVNKTAENKAYALGEEVTFTITATNIYDKASTITLSEIAGVTLAKSEFEAAAGETVTTTATYTIKEADIVKGSFTNTVTAKLGEIEKTANATVETEAKNAHLTVTKESDVEEGKKVDLGEVITYTITVENDGNVTISGIQLTDTVAGYEPADITANLDKTTLAPGESATATFTHEVTEKDILAGSVKNEATAKGSDPEDKDPEVVPGTTDDPTVPKNAHLTVTKESDVEEGKKVELGEVITYTITVENDGNVTISGIQLTDTVAGYEPADITANLDKTTLAPGESATATFTHEVTEQDILAGSVKNEATAKGSDPEDKDPEVVPGTTDDPTVPKNAHLTVTKTSDVAADTKLKLGDKVTYTITVTNDGNLTISDVEIKDELPGFKFNDDAVTAFDALAPGESKSAEGTYIVTQADVDAGKVVNTAIAKGVDPEDKDPEVVPGTKDDPTVDPDARLAVTKTADKVSGVKAGELITYTVTVSNPGNVTISNIKLSDSLVSLGEAAFTLAPGASKVVTYGYVVTAANAAAGSVVNTAAANGTDPKGNAVNGRASVTVGTTAKEDTPDPNPNPGPNPRPNPRPNPNPNPGGGNPVVNPGAPDAAAAADIADDAVPQAEEPEAVEIDEPAVPLAQGAWALVNLICAALATIGAVIELFRKKEDDDEDEEDENGEGKDGEAKDAAKAAMAAAAKAAADADKADDSADEEDEEKDTRGRKMTIAKVIGALAAVASIVAFILTEDMSLPMILTDKWTLLMVVLFGGQIASAIGAKRAAKKDDEEDEDGKGGAGEGESGEGANA
ncbi:MAG: DUF11 domain-containing protein [Mogibacterium sp.]|nr:DUF11 domain-containing protein [Mogibacterium sp.]